MEYFLLIRQVRRIAGDAMRLIALLIDAALWVVYVIAAVVVVLCYDCSGIGEKE